MDQQESRNWFVGSLVCRSHKNNHSNNGMNKVEIIERQGGGKRRDGLPLAKIKVQGIVLQLSHDLGPASPRASVRLAQDS